MYARSIATQSNERRRDRSARAVRPDPAAQQVDVVRVTVRRVHDDEATARRRDVAPVGRGARAITGFRVRPAIARAVDVEPQRRLPARRIGRDLAPAQRDVSLGPRQAPRRRSSEQRTRNGSDCAKCATALLTRIDGGKGRGMVAVRVLCLRCLCVENARRTGRDVTMSAKMGHATALPLPDYTASALVRTQPLGNLTCGASANKTHDEKKKRSEKKPSPCPQKGDGLLFYVMRCSVSL